MEKRTFNNENVRTAALELNRNEFDILMTIALKYCKMQYDGYFSSSIEGFTADTGIGMSTVRKVLGSLTKKGYIDVKHNYGKENFYTPLKVVEVEKIESYI